MKATTKTAKVCVVMPALNEEATIANVIERVPRDLDGVAEVAVIVVDDGLDRKALAERGYEKVTCVDISPRLLRSVEGSRLVADAHVLPFPTGSVHAILANSVLHHFDPPVALAEIARVLRPGGKLCFMEPRPCLPRKVVDWVTLRSGIDRVVPFFDARKRSLSEEMDVYSHWLDVYPQVPHWLTESGLRCEKEKHTLFGILSEWRKRRNG